MQWVRKHYLVHVRSLSDNALLGVPAPTTHTSCLLTVCAQRYVLEAVLCVQSALVARRPQKLFEDNYAVFIDIEFIHDVV